jgi:hypothetical protein
MNVDYLFKRFVANSYGALTPLFLKALNRSTPVFTPMTGSSNVLRSMKKKILLMMTMFYSERV